jgi:hypothetical protein
MYLWYTFWKCFFLFPLKYCFLNSKNQIKIFAWIMLGFINQYLLIFWQMLVHVHEVIRIPVNNYKSWDGLIYMYFYFTMILKQTSSTTYINASRQLGFWHERVINEMRKQHYSEETCMPAPPISPHIQPLLTITWVTAVKSQCVNYNATYTQMNWEIGLNKYKYI